MKLPGREVRVSSWNELMSELHSRALIPPRPDEGGHLRSPYVFRGADDASWKLQTSLGRLPGATSQNISIIEHSLIRSFRKYASAGAFDDKSEWYVLAVAPAQRPTHKVFRLDAVSSCSRPLHVW